VGELLIPKWQTENSSASKTGKNGLAGKLGSRDDLSQNQTKGG